MIYISVNPVGSKFAKAIQTAIAATGARCLRCSTRKGDDHKRRGRKVFDVVRQPLNKVEQFARFAQHNVSAPKYALNAADARALGAKTLFARTLINSTNGRGIVEFDASIEQYPRAPLYTEYIPKKNEYRVHVMNGKVIDVQQKRKRRGFEGERDTRVRNVQNGYVYTRNDLHIPADLGDLAVRAVAAVGYSYGAVDVIYNEKRNCLYVLEVNSRPGLSGTTPSFYAEEIAK